MQPADAPQRTQPELVRLARIRPRNPVWLCGVDADLPSPVPDVLRGSALARSGGGQADFI